MKGGFANFLSNFVSKKDKPKDTGTNEDKAPPGDDDEINRYLRLPQMSVQDSQGCDRDILEWWRDQQPYLPNLSKMARQFLAAPASSASAERLFSSAGKMHDDLKKNTSEETLESMLTVGLNFPNA